jgi:hypothetical protein
MVLPGLKVAVPPPVKGNFGCLLILQMLILGDSGCLQAPFMVCFSN